MLSKGHKLSLVSNKYSPIIAIPPGGKSVSVIIDSLAISFVRHNGSKDSLNV